MLLLLYLNYIKIIKYIKFIYHENSINLTDILYFFQKIIFKTNLLNI